MCGPAAFPNLVGMKHFAVVALLAVAGCTGGGSNVADAPEDAASPWYAAAASGDAGDARQAIWVGADPDVRGRRGRTPLIEAIWAGHDDATAAMLEAGADPNLTDSRGQFPLQYAARGDRTAIARDLLDAGADVDALGSPYPSPLYYAALGGDADLVALLLDAGADPTLKDSRGRLPLDVARAKNRGEAVRVLQAYRPGGPPLYDGNRPEVTDSTATRPSAP